MCILPVINNLIKGIILLQYIRIYMLKRQEGILSKSSNSSVENGTFWPWKPSSVTMKWSVRQ